MRIRMRMPFAGREHEKDREAGAATVPHVVIVGGGVAGLTAAYDLRRRLGRRAAITVVSGSDRFLLWLGLPWIPFGHRLGRITFSIPRTLERQGIAFRRAHVHTILPRQHLVPLPDGHLHYDYLLIATGPRYNGLAFTGFSEERTVSGPLWSEPAATQATRTLAQFLSQPGAVVVGAAHDATHLHAGYEFILTLDHALRRRALRSRATLTFVTPEPYLGHAGAGVPAARRILERLFAERQIAVLTESIVEGVDRDGALIRASRARACHRVPASYLAVLPPADGGAGPWRLPGLTDGHGLVPVDAHYRHAQFPEIFAAGDVARVPVPDVPFTGGLPRTGFLARAMARRAARNLAAAILGTAPAGRTLPRLLDFRILDGGDTGLLLVTAQLVRPVQLALPLPGRLAHYGKLMLARYILWKLRTGRTYLP
jgi:sulfide:quinone oxidoreductase